MLNKKSIVMILTNGYDPDIRVKREAEYLVSRNNKVTILCWDRENRYCDESNVSENGINIIRCFETAEYGSGFRKQMFAFLKFIIFCFNYLRKHNYDYLHCHDLDGCIAGLLANIKRKKIVFDMHEYYKIYTNKYKNFLVGVLVQVCQKLSYSIIYLNSKQKSDIKKGNLKKIVYLPNYACSFKSTTKIPSNKLRIAYIGSVRCYNELENLILASDEFDDIEVYIHGGGVSYARLNENYRDYNGCYITGQYDYLQTEELYANADIIYAVYENQPSFNNAYPIKLFESINSITPLIVGNNTVCEKMINKYKIGISVNGQDRTDIKDKLEYLLNNRECINEFKSNIVNNRLNEKYIWQNVVKNMDLIYK